MRPKLTLAAGAVLLLASIVVRVGAQGAPPATPEPNGQGAGGRGGRGAGRAGGGNNGQSFPAQQRQLADAAQIERGKALYGVNCNSCHGSDLRGGDMGGPNLLRSDLVLTDQNGELILPIVHGSRQQQGMDPINIPDADVKAIAAYIHSVAATMRGQGNPPPGAEVRAQHRGRQRRGRQAYFQAKCSTCHSATGDLKGIATRVASPMALQNLWVSGGGGGRGGRGGGEAPGRHGHRDARRRSEGRRPTRPHRRLHRDADGCERRCRTASAATATCRRSRLTIRWRRTESCCPSTRTKTFTT